MPVKSVPMPGNREQAGNAYMLESALDKNDCFVIQQACVYLLRLLARYPILDREVLEFAFWAIGPEIAELNQNLLESATKREAERLRDDLDDCLDFEDHARVLLKAVKQDKKKASRFMDSLFRTLEQRKKQMRSANLSQLKHNSRKFGELFSLSEEEMEMCLLLFFDQQLGPVQASVQVPSGYRGVFRSQIPPGTPGHELLQSGKAHAGQAEQAGHSFQERRRSGFE